jgi:hypothetical protein
VSARTEFGIICDRRELGLGKALLATAYTAENAWRAADGKCGVKGKHDHVLVERRVAYTEWTEVG